MKRTAVKQQDPELIQKISVTGARMTPPAYGLPFIDNAVVQRNKNNTGMPDNLQKGIESLSGMDMSDVKVHRNSSEPAQLNAHAYAQGTDIHIAPGQEKHLPHEAWHVVQQKQGRVKPTTQMENIAINDDISLETEASVMGASAVAQRHNTRPLRESIVPAPAFQLMVSSGVIQLMKPDAPGWYNLQGKGRKYYKGGGPDKDGKYKFYSAPDKIMATSCSEAEILSKADDGSSTAPAPVKKVVRSNDNNEIIEPREKSSDEDLQREEELRKKTEFEKEAAEENEHAKYPEPKPEPYWDRAIGNTTGDQLQFLRSVVAQARKILPVAINRDQERSKNTVVNGKDWVNDKFMCVETIVKDFSTFMRTNGMLVEFNYVHPAALERIIILVNNVADKLEPSAQVDKRMSGICKDFASIVFGLIIQNDAGSQLKPRLGFIKDHVFVEVNVDGEDYVVDAWRTAGTPNDGVVKKSEHILDLNEESRRGTGTFKDFDASYSDGVLKKENKMKQASVDSQYKNYKKVYHLWMSQEARYKTLAEEKLKSGFEKYDVTGKY